MNKSNPILKLSQTFYRYADNNAAPRQNIVTAISKFKNELADAFNDFITGQSLSDDEYSAVTQANNVTIHTPYVAKKLGDKYQVRVSVMVSSDPVVAANAFKKISEYLARRVGPAMSAQASHAASEFASKETSDFKVTILPMVKIN